MKAVFADSYYFLALLSDDDAGHDRAVAASRALTGAIVTTTWVLTEVADAMADPLHRSEFVAYMEALRADPMVDIVPASQEVFDLGMELYARRRDKDWPLTDCISFVVMHKHGLTDALTADRHFEQAGFKVLLK